jgi:hypothetical protein
VETMAASNPPQVSKGEMTLYGRLMLGIYCRFELRLR